MTQAQQPEALEDFKLRKMAALGPVHASSGLVERRPAEYRRELEDQFVRGFRAAESRQRARIKELEAQLYAIGAGGVEPLRKCLHQIAEPGCTRSHPHEAMSPECRIRAVIAEMRNREARGAEATEHCLGRFADVLERALSDRAMRAQAAPAYIDSTPELHVADSAFESWYSNYLLNAPVHQPMKQRARDAYAAGMGDPMVMAAPASGNWVSAADVDRLVRELDVALNGEEGAAPQASLCDVVGQAKAEAAKLGRPLLAAPAAVAGPAYLCQAWGETDLPAAAIVHDMESVRAFLIEEWLGSEDDEDATGTKTLPEVMQELQNGWDENGDAWKWSVEFEIGGISVEKVGHSAPAAVAGPSDHELDSLVQKHFGWQLTVSEANHRAFARAVLAQWGAAPNTQAAPQPAPVAQGDALDELLAAAADFLDVSDEREGQPGEDWQSEANRRAETRLRAAIDAARAQAKEGASHG